MGLQEDTAWFDQNRAFIAGKYQGQWVLVKDQAVRGAYASYSAAYTAGVNQFGTQPFLVKEATEEDPIVSI
jgi:hypothetical protein